MLGQDAGEKWECFRFFIFIFCQKYVNFRPSYPYPVLSPNRRQNIRSTQIYMMSLYTVASHFPCTGTDSCAQSYRSCYRRSYILHRALTSVPLDTIGMHWHADGTPDLFAWNQFRTSLMLADENKSPQPSLNGDFYLFFLNLFFFKDFICTNVEWYFLQTSTCMSVLICINWVMESLYNHIMLHITCA